MAPATVVTTAAAAADPNGVSGDMGRPWAGLNGEKGRWGGCWEAACAAAAAAWAPAAAAAAWAAAGDHG